MNCKKCGSPLVEGATFCNVCGEKVEGQVVSPVNMVPIEPVAPSPVPNPVNGVQPPQVGNAPIAPVVNNAGIINGEPIQPTMNNVQPTVPVQPVENINQPGIPVQPTVNNVQTASPVQPIDNINQPVSTNVVEQPSNMAPVGPQPAANMAIPQNEGKKNNMLFFIICGFLAVVIIVLVVLILNNNSGSGKKTADEPKTTAAENKTSSTTSSTTLPRTQATPTSGNYADYYGIKLYVPETFVTQNQNNVLVYTSTSKRQMFMIQVTAYDYEDAILEFDDFVKSMEESGLISTTKSQTEYKGMKYSIVRGTVSGENVSTGFAKFASGYTVMFIFRTAYATENEYLETLLQIVSNSNTSSTFSKTPSNDDKISSFIKDFSKLNIE